MDRGKRKHAVGVVTSDRMQKSVVVEVTRLVRHPLYGKIMTRRTKLMAHNEVGAAAGDRVEMVETRPLSKRKSWRVLRVVEKARLHDVAPELVAVPEIPSSPAVKTE